MKKNDLKKMQAQLGITDRKTVEERGRQRRPAVFVDRRAKARKNACDKQVVKKFLNDF